MSYPPDVFGPIAGGEIQIVGQPVAQVVTVEQIRAHKQVMRRRLIGRGERLRRRDPHRRP